MTVERDSFEMAVRHGEIMRACAPKFNVSGWLAEIGDRNGISERQMKNLYYGKNAPSLDNFYKFVADRLLGVDYANLMLAGTGVCCTGSLPDDVARPGVAAQAATLRTIADLLESGDGK